MVAPILLDSPLTSSRGRISDHAHRFAVVSYGPYRPVADNDTAEGRSTNRMVRVVLHKPSN